ncbi:MAG: 3-deoxy-manno-octulosonate cytidylyltransferase [Gammaproteobacteria bacterium]|nr:3-deoxy-manno-octulosonate cytidylyltransferase [Gammaproteobacteria bacterium]
MREFHVIIPARFNSSRLPGKPLLDIAGKPMIQHVYERAQQSGAISVVIATDDKKIADKARGFGAKVCMTSSEHLSGTDRIAEAVVALALDDDDIVVNVQGDEPLIHPKLIHQVATNLAMHNNVKSATLCEVIESSDDLLNPNIVKVVMNHRNYAMYFSRSPIPFDRDNPPEVGKSLTTTYYRHRGIYAYRVGFLLEYTEWGESPLEEQEHLEQLRTLWHGARIHVDLSKEKIPMDVNTQEDLDMVREILEKSN